jgi:hypothetical protein
MDKPRIYLETTVFSFYYGPEATPEYKQYKAFTSTLATDELTDEPDEEKRLKCLLLFLNTV